MYNSCSYHIIRLLKRKRNKVRDVITCKANDLRRKNEGFLIKPHKPRVAMCPTPYINLTKTTPRKIIMIIIKIQIIIYFVVGDHFVNSQNAYIQIQPFWNLLSLKSSIQSKPHKNNQLLCLRTFVQEEKKKDIMIGG